MAGSDPGAALPLGDPEVVHRHGGSERPAPGSAVPMSLRQICCGSLPPSASAWVGQTRQHASRQAAPQQIPASHASRMSQRSRRTVTTRQFARINHPLWRYVRANCSK